MDRVDKVKEFLNGLIASLQRAKLYSTEHMIFKNSVDKVYGQLQDILEEKGELIIGIVSGEFAFEREIFFELSNFDLAKKIIAFFQEKNIEKIIFYPLVSKDELYMFISFIVSPPKEEIKIDLDDYLLTLGVKNITVGKIKSSKTVSNGGMRPLDYSSLYEDYLKVFSEYTEAILNNKPTDFSTLKATVVNIMENMRTRYQEILKLTVIKKFDDKKLLHGVNVSILAMYFSFKAGFSKRDIFDMGLAALFHDIGKIYIDKRIRGGGIDLAQEEAAYSKSHTQWGAGILLQYVEAFGILPVLVSFEHHLRYDFRSDFPLLSKYKSHIASSIVAICDIYNSLSQRRSPKYNYPADAIYNLMLKGKGKAFDPELLDIFFRIIGIWPIGTVILLNDGSVAIVRRVDEEDMYACEVEIVDPQERKGIVNLKNKKEELRIERALNPFAEGKVYLQLV